MDSCGTAEPLDLGLALASGRGLAFEGEGVAGLAGIATCSPHWKHVQKAAPAPPGGTQIVAPQWHGKE